MTVWERYRNECTIIPAATAGDFVVKLDVKNWKTAMGDAHVHLILDAEKVAVEERTQAGQQGSATEELGEIGHQGSGLTLDWQSCHEFS